MDRKSFISLVSQAVPGLALVNSNHDSKEALKPKVPPFLKKGDVIGVTCPSGFISQDEIIPAMQKMEEWGFRVKVGKTVNLRDFTFAGTDEDRITDLQEMLDDRSINAIMLGRGGYGAVRIVDRMDFSHFRKAPKWIMGFSDATVFHSHLQHVFGIASIHCKMCNSFPDDWATATSEQVLSIDSIRQALTGESIQYPVANNVYNKHGEGTGILTGGNLSILENLAATASDNQTKGKILFIEETGEYLYNIDRMFWNLARTGKLAHLAGLIVGGMKYKPDDPGEEFGKTIIDIVLEKVAGYSYPVCFDFPVGHQKENYALKCGVEHRLEVTPDELKLTDKSIRK